MGFPSKQQARSASRGLAWFSIGLGLLELLAARRLSRAVGLPGQAPLVRAYGLREIASGVGLLNAREPAPWLWGRVAGDALDLATLAVAYGERRPDRRTGPAVALAAVAGFTAVDWACARAASRAPAQAAADYAGRSGWPLPVEEMRGAALTDFEPPADLSTPKALRWRAPVAQTVNAEAPAGPA
jgi:hypothetical protein